MPNVLIIPTAKRTQEAWEKFVPATKQYFESRGLPTNLLHERNYYHQERMEELVEDADLVYVSGGDTLHMMETLTAYDIAPRLGRRALVGNVVLSGASAGAIMPTSWGHSDSLSYRPETSTTWDYIRVNGLGLVSVAVTPHFSNRDERLGLRSSRFAEMLQDQNDTSLGIGLDNFASYIVNDGVLVPYTPYNGEHDHLLERDSSGKFTPHIMEPGETILINST